MTVRLGYTGAVALVTGASSGMGRAAARAFAGAGASTVLVDIDRDAVEAFGSELASYVTGVALPVDGGYSAR